VTLYEQVNVKGRLEAGRWLKSLPERSTPYESDMAMCIGQLLRVIV
jgi:hypothetical protein